MDNVKPEQRSDNMRKIRSKGTEPELIVRRLVYAMGYRYRLHYGKLPGKPDMVFPGKRKVIFVHGCFWHQHEKCKSGRMPKSRLAYWVPKLEKNKNRDTSNQEKLREMGWDILVVWECELKDIEQISRQLASYLAGFTLR